MRQPIAGLGGNSLGRQSGSELWMTIYGKICTQQDWEAEAAKAEATLHYRGLGTQAREQGLWTLSTFSVFLCVQTEYTLIHSQTGVVWDNAGRLCHSAHTQGFLTAKVEHWMNGELKDWVQIQHTLHIWSFILYTGSVWSTNAEHAFYIKQCTMWCYGYS